MLIFAIDDEKLALEALVSAIQKAVPEAVVRGFRKPEEVLAQLDAEIPAVVFLDFWM